MLADGPLQRGIRHGEIAAVTCVTGSVLRTPESAGIGTWRTTISYFEHDGTIYSDAQSVPAGAHEAPGYRAVAMDDVLAPK